jgi:predicted exporter
MRLQLAAYARAEFIARSGDPERHPLSRHRTPEEQEATLAALRSAWEGVRARVGDAADAAGVRLELPAAPPRRVLGEWEFLALLGEVGPVRWSDEAGGRRYVDAGLVRVPPDLAARGIVPLGPRTHYDELLTALSRQLGWLFLAGFAAMAAYLAWLQRDAARILYVFAPVLAVAAAFSAWSRLTGTPLTIVHFMGFSLVIAVAMDYTAVAVSSGHGPVELSKVLLTGLSAVGTFGVLALARHPVLRSLGATVVAGALPSLLFALVVRLRPAREGAP